VASLKSSSYGKPGLRIKRKYILAALGLLMGGATKLKAKSIVTAETFENHITYYLCSEMEQIQRTHKSDAIWWDPRVNTQNDPNDPLSRGEIDVKFRWAQYPPVNERYLAVEAKRLFGKGDSLAGKYVEEGVQDFFIAKYSRGHNYGIMLGYVLIGPLEKAITAVKDAMTTRSLQTGECSPFTPDDSFCSHPHTHRSIHLQHATAIQIILIHLFLDFSTE
jgi:hypothetical protein